MMKRTLPSQEYLRQCFDYDPETGVLRWRERPIEHFKSVQAWRAWTTKYAGQPFGCQSNGYVLGGLGGVNWFAHCIIWKLVHDEEPPEVDHRNRVRDDNRLDNLRAASSSQNKHNSPARQGNVSGFKGVSRNWGKWAARICVDRRTICLGSFSTPEEASAAYRAAAAKYHGEFASQ
jgi:hypothetical protein